MMAEIRKRTGVATIFGIQSSWLSSLVALANLLLGQSSDYEEEVKGSERLDDGFDLQT